jgi:hypothetical protein
MLKPSTTRSSRAGRRKKNTPTLPPATDWRTTDEDEILKRRLRAREERHQIVNLDPDHPVFSNFEVHSPSGMTYQVELRDLVSSQFSCTCTDFRTNGLGICKHVEAVLLQLSRRQRAEYKAAQRLSSDRVDLVPTDAGLRVERCFEKLPRGLRAYFDEAGQQRSEVDPAEIVREFVSSRNGNLRVSQDVAPWLESRRRSEESILLRREYEVGV